MKPYRLINAFELAQLNDQFSQIVDEWSQEYSLTPLNVSMATLPKNYSVTTEPIIQALDHDLGLITGDYLNIVKESLFGNNNACFNSTSKDLLSILLNRLFKTEKCSLTPILQTPDWFYAGSTTLLVTLSCKQDNITLILNPDWVYQQLPKNHETHTKPDSLHDALAEQTVSLHVELMPSTLSIKNIATIQVGDVLSTNHPLTSPLRLTRGNGLLALAELGQSAHHKSIVLKRSS